MGGKQHTANSSSNTTQIQVSTTQQLGTLEPWLRDVIEKGKVIIRELARESFVRYRQLGLLILNSGYRKGQWRNAERERVMAAWEISQRTFSNLIQLGEMSELEFSNAVAKFKSLHDWASQKEPQLDLGADDEDSLPELIEVQTTIQLGDVFSLGRHRLMCGDATNVSHIQILLDGQMPSELLTDPPYGINVVSRGKIGDDHFARAKTYPIIIGDQKPFNPSHLLHLAPIVILFGANYYSDKLPVSPGWLIWDKESGRDWEDTFADCELIWTNSKRHARIYRCLWKGMVKEGESGTRFHPTQKPVKLLRDIILDTTQPDQLVLDCYGGSGSTLIACELTDRRCHIMDIEPRYCQVMINRWENLTKNKAVKVN